MLQKRPVIKSAVFPGSRSQVEGYQRFIRSLCENLARIRRQESGEKENPGVQMQFESDIQPGNQFCWLK